MRARSDAFGPAFGSGRRSGRVNPGPHGTRQAVKAMQAGAARVEQGSHKADLAGQALQAILTAVEHTVHQANEIASADRLVPLRRAA